jgi:hypothetical protein
MMKRLFGLVAGVLLSLLVLTPLAHADVNDFVIEAFDADYTLTSDDKQGQLRVIENIAVNFSDNNHGILRALPDHYKKHRLETKIESVTSSTGAPAQYSTYGSNSNKVLRIGDPNKTVTGRQVYTIIYTMRNVMGFYPGHDEFYWDINGDQWQQQANRVSVVLRMPPGVEFARNNDTLCFTGSFGSTNHDCTIEQDREGQRVIVHTTKALQGYETLSIVVGFEKGHFTPSAWHETLGEYRGTALRFLAPLLLIGGLAWRHWRRNGRDAKGRDTIVPEYEAPDNLKPIEAGTVADFRTDNRDITATIIDLAIRGYVKIIESTKVRKLRKDLKVYSLRLEHTDFSKLNSFETKILKGIFTKQEKGEEIDLAAMKYKLVSTATQLRKDVREHLVSTGYFRKTPLSASLRFFGLLALAYLASIVMTVIWNDAASKVGIGAATAATVIFLILLPSRTPKGVAAKEGIMGLKLYLETAEKKRLEKLQSPDAPYMPKSAAPKRTVELFEKLLPYAMVLGVEEAWAKQFENIYKTPPDWYQGNWSAFSAVYLTTSLNSGVQSAVNTAFSSPSSSSGSGFSGGGSGGGGGGGGGGGW